MLLIEDDKVVASIYSSKLQMEGYQIAIAADGESGVKSLEMMMPDLVVLDLGLPKMNGVEVLKIIRGNPLLNHLPVIVFTNAYLGNMVQDAWKAGATACLVKSSCTPRQLIEVLKRHLDAPAVAAPVAAPAAAVPAPVQAPVESDADAAFQAELRLSFTQSAPASINVLRSLLQAFGKGENDSERMSKLKELHQKTRSLTGNAGMAGFEIVSRMSMALEALLKELYEKPASINPSVLRTVAQTIDCIAILMEKGSALAEFPAKDVNILVVDDELLSRRAVIYALEKAQLKCVSVEDSTVAKGMLDENRFGLIILDVDMPGMDGFALCKHARTTVRNQKTPVIFVTSLSDFENRAKSALSGGNDLIAKPFLFIELAVKALGYVVKGQLEEALKSR